MFVCPVCNSHTVTVYGGNNTAKCDGCGTFDALHKFQAATITTGDSIRDPLAIFPPDDIIAAMTRMHEYFVRDRGAKQWAFGYVQSRDEPALIGIEHVRNMAAAFRMELIVRPTVEDLTKKVHSYIGRANGMYQNLSSTQQVNHNKKEFVCEQIARLMLADLFPQ